MIAVIPAQAGIQGFLLPFLDSGLRRNDDTFQFERRSNAASFLRTKHSAMPALFVFIRAIITRKPGRSLRFRAMARAMKRVRVYAREIASPRLIALGSPLSTDFQGAGFGYAR
ncbi:MAG: hypothetical protein ACM31P_19140 [Actinomycetota bacterium]